MRLLGLFRRSNEGRRGAEASGPSRQCPHPVAHQMALYEDSGDPHKVTAMKCTQCGDRIPLAEAA